VSAEETYDYWGKRAQSFLGRSRKTIYRLRKTGKLPDRKNWTKAELERCLSSLLPRKDDVAKKKATTPNAPEGPAPTQGAVTPSAPESPAPTRNDPPPPSPAPERPATPPPAAEKPAGGACKGVDDHVCHEGCPLHVDFPSGRPWKKGAKETTSSKAADEDDGWGTFEGEDVRE
jgi:hypothetical protein